MQWSSPPPPSLHPKGTRSRIKYSFSQFCIQQTLLPKQRFFAVLTLNSWTAFLVKVSGHKLKSSQTQVFVWFSTLVFPFYKKGYSWLNSSFLVSRTFLDGFLKSEKGRVFWKDRQQKGLIAWSNRPESFVNLMFTNSISVQEPFHLYLCSFFSVKSESHHVENEV